MRRAARMDKDIGTEPGKTPGGTGVIKVNVAEEDMPNVVRAEAGFRKIDNDVIESRFRTGIKKGDAVVGFERGGGNDAGPAELTGIKDANHRRCLMFDVSSFVKTTAREVTFDVKAEKRDVTVTSRNKRPRWKR